MLRLDRSPSISSPSPSPWIEPDPTPGSKDASPQLYLAAGPDRAQESLRRARIYLSSCARAWGGQGLMPHEDTSMADKSKGNDGKKRRKKKPPELKETKKG